MGVRDIVTKHWAQCGRHFCCRYDYEGVDSDAANRVMDTIRERFMDGNASSVEAGESGIKLVDAISSGTPREQLVGQAANHKTFAHVANFLCSAPLPIHGAATPIPSTGPKSGADHELGIRR